MHTECVIEKCITCGRDFRTYVPNTRCHLPDGAIVSYTDPQLECPSCDSSKYGWFMNQDLFPEELLSTDTGALEPENA